LRQNAERQLHQVNTTLKLPISTTQMPPSGSAAFLLPSAEPKPQKPPLPPSGGALKPFGVIAEAVLSEAPPDATKAKLWTSSDDLPLYISLDACRALISNLKEAGNG
jgi:hypothetical protein